jgi:putative transposase
LTLVVSGTVSSHRGSGTAIQHGSKIRLAKGSNRKEKYLDFILVEYETRPDVTVENLQQVRAVWAGDEWELHLVCRKEVPVGNAPGEKTAGIDLGISNYLAIDFEDGPSELYPGNALKEDKHYFTQEQYATEGENGPSKRARRAIWKLSRRKEHFLHTLSKHIVDRCVEQDVGRIAVGDLSGIHEDESGRARDWGQSGNKRLHRWAFDRFTRQLEYKAEERGILVDRVDETNTSKTCSVCGACRDSNRVERGLYVCSSCETTMNADVNGAVNIRQKLTQSPSTGDMSNGCLAQPVVFLFDRESGRFTPREQGDSKS